LKSNPKRWRRLFWLAVIVFAVWLLILVASRGTFRLSRPASEAGGSAITVGAAGHRIAGRVYLTGTPASAAPIAIVLHGDAPFENPSYQYAFASRLARAIPGTRVVALLRPGYADPYGAKSDGDRGFALGENYTPAVVNDVAAAIQSIKSQWGASTVTLVGHSGGASIAADVAALHPGLVQNLFLVGCPCDVPAFRRHMARLQWNPMWLLSAHSLSPAQTLNQMRKGTKVTAISGANDPIALPQYARAYVAKANELGISASMITIPGKGHEILNDPAVINDVAEAVRGGRRSSHIKLICNLSLEKPNVHCAAEDVPIHRLLDIAAARPLRQVELLVEGI
jgi:pimeloyl-ACP methyl ester carboxylesterase